MIKEAKRVLIYRLGSLGDTIVALPCLHLIKRAFPKAERFILTATPSNKKAPAISLVLGESGLVSGYLTYSYRINDIKGLCQLRNKIKQWAPEVLVYLPGQRSYLRRLRDILFFKACGIKKIVGMTYSKDLQTHQMLPDKLYFEHEAVRLAKCLSVLGDAKLSEPSNWDLLLSLQEYRDAEGLLGGWPGRNRYIACSIGTKFEVNDWGNQNWQALLSKLGQKYSGYGLVMLGSDDEFGRSQELCRSWSGLSLNLCGKISLRCAAIIIKKANIFLGHDSGPMHLAACVGIPCVVVFSARNKPGVWFPYGPSHRVIYHKTKCFGCGLAVCKKYKKKCINSVTVDEVFEAACNTMDRYGPVNNHHKL